MHKQDMLRPAGHAPVTQATSAALTRHLYRGVSPAPSKPVALVARLLVPALAAAAAWTQPWIGALFAGLLAIWSFWAIPALASKLPLNGPKAMNSVGFGERIWQHSLHDLPQDTGLRKIGGLYILQWVTTTVAVTGGLLGSPWITIAGLLLAYAALLFNFRSLAALYAARRRTHPLYRFWERSPGNDNRKASGRQARSAKSSS